uniref:C-type lectin domain-containing protein n=1 Tax=Xiphophorus couchianus TaxID=32473 RepID=A0A3B5KQK7_9TELE
MSAHTCASVYSAVSSALCLPLALMFLEVHPYCLDFPDQVKNWQDAEADCVKEGANLVSIHNHEEEEFLSVYSKGKPNDSSFITGYSWSDGTPLSHTNWGHGEPNNHEGREECVEMVSSNNGTFSWWNDLNCDAHQDWICMISKGKTPIIPPVPPSPVPGKLSLSCTSCSNLQGKII